MKTNVPLSSYVLSLALSCNGGGGPKTSGHCADYTAVGVGQRTRRPEGSGCQTDLGVATRARAAHATCDVELGTLESILTSKAALSQIRTSDCSPL